MENKYKIYKGPEKITDNVGILDFDNPKYYKPSKSLSDAVNVAILLGKPLLITGEPGTGKSQLANSIAYDLELNLYKYIAKTNSISRDIFYYYDSIRHFHDANLAKSTINQLDIVNTSDYTKYIRFEALGMAIKEASINKSEKEKKRSVVLIDEIDKAPRDFPNDILYELEELYFKINETGEEYLADKKYRPIIIITSNSERLLPDAFLRRCLYYHIEFPNENQLMEIILNRIKDGNAKNGGLRLSYSNQEIEIIIQHFFEIREICTLKPPATAELLSWLQLLEKLNLNIEKLKDISSLGETEREILGLSYSILAKHKEDILKLKDRFL
ncbi:AAA family ATPase [Flexithrix dorotheae]|uniref:AAA family ATPase n=1 Tax=Flexithrix dorotheae TaxID=70993 RepID=UPI00037BEADA|nr:MoxR family ATPase [Flexithrix dorotheae]